MKNNKILIPAILIALIMILAAYVANQDLDYTEPDIQGNFVYFGGYRMEFRAPIEQAEDIKVYPNKKVLRDLLLNDNITEVKIVIMSNETVNGHYILVSHFIAVDLPLIIETEVGAKPNITASGVASKQEAIDMSTPEKPVIMLLHPSLSNKTAVTVENNTIFLEGKTLDIDNDEYIDLDLAAGKMLLSLMDGYVVRG